MAAPSRWRDTVLVCVQTLLSNGVGASVGLEAAYAQAGGGFASIVGQWLRLRRADMRILLGAGAGAAIGAAFSAPLTGAFYAFEIVIGAYTPAAIAPVAAAALSAVLTARLLGLEAYIIALPGAKAITTDDYLIYAALGVICAAIAVTIMRIVTFLEERIRGSALIEVLASGGRRPAPHSTCADHPAGSLGRARSASHRSRRRGRLCASFFLIFVLKVAASSISLGFGFRGGLFFASLFIGSLAGPAVRRSAGADQRRAAHRSIGCGADRNGGHGCLDRRRPDDDVAAGSRNHPRFHA